MKAGRLIVSVLLVGILIAACAGIANQASKHAGSSPQSVTSSRPSPSTDRISRLKKAQDEADTKYQADLLAYEALVIRLEDQHLAILDAYEAKKATHDKEMRAHDSAKLEYDATAKLAQARGLYDDSKAKAARGVEPEATKLMGFARKRLQEIAQSFPDTQAAKDAKLMLAGKSVAERSLPFIPTKPASLPDPPILELPHPPQQLVAVVVEDSHAPQTKSGTHASSVPNPAGFASSLPGITYHPRTPSGSSHASSGSIYVHGYTRKDGTVVSGYQRRHR
jgi:hypothetical protein